MHLITRVLGPGISLLPLLAAGQGFVETCFYKGARFTDNFLGMYCLNNDAVIYGYNWTWLDMNLCYGNNGGRLLALNHGDYAGSCPRCSISNDTTLWMTCSCWDTDNKQPTTRVDLNHTIGNNDGAMFCFNNLGNKTWIGPS